MASRENGLQPKEATLFKSIVKHYETKQYKKGLKAADAVLKKVPEHGETLAMKGLILNCQERKTEAYELVALGVKKDIRSHVCWHVYGLLYRSDREYLKAIKCYRSALRHDPENVQILRDLSLLQVQMRDLDGFVETRKKLLTLKPTNKNNWFTFAVSEHLSGRKKEAAGIIQSFEDTLEGAPENEYEHSEMLLYKNMLLEEQGLKDECLEHLVKHEKEIVDGLCVLEKRAQLLRELGKFAEAEPLYRQLLKRNPEHYSYHAGVQACILQSTAPPIEQWLGADVSAEAESKLKALYEELMHTHPRSTVCRRLPLDFSRQASYFRVALKTYILPPLRKGVPSLFADLKPLYKDADKVKVLGDVFKEWLAALEKDGKLQGEKSCEMPTTIMWLRMLMAQHLDKLGDGHGAIEQIDLAIAHTPTLLDLYMVKARIYKHAGALDAAADWMDRARKMDLQDRYINTKCTRYMLRADKVDDAVKTIALFTKNGDNESNLFDMQCMWYELETASSMVRQGELGKALKQYTSVDKHFTDIIEDQFDFHTYCIRKMTLRAYVAMLRLEDGVYVERMGFYRKAASGAVEAYMSLFDKPKGAAADAAEDAEDGLSAAERKKLESKRRKAEAKAKAEAEAKAKAEAAAGAKADGGGGKGGKGGKKASDKPVDEDPDGAALAAAEDPLSKALPFLSILQAHASGELATQLLSCALYMRKGKLLLVLRALIKAVKIAGGTTDEPGVHCALVRFLHAVDAATKAGSAGETVLKVIDGQRSAIGAPAKGESLEAFNKAFLLKAQQQQPASAKASALLAAAEMQVLLDPSSKAAAAALLSGGVDVGSLPLPLTCEVHAALSKKLGAADLATQFKEKALKVFPFAQYFGGFVPEKDRPEPEKAPAPPAA